jgi:hypothetical protein
LAAAALVAVLVAGLLAANWGTVRDHVEAWRFQAAQETTTFQPLSSLAEGDMVMGPASAFQALATCSKRTVVFDPNFTHRELWSVTREATLNPDELLRVIERNGWRVIKQHFPTKVYVVIRRHR